VSFFIFYNPLFDLIRIAKLGTAALDFGFRIVDLAKNDGFVKSPHPVTPAKAGVQKLLK